jgi:hypothetical protein
MAQSDITIALTTLKIWPVNKMVGNVRNKGPQLAMPL